MKWRTIYGASIAASAIIGAWLILTGRIPAFDLAAKLAGIRDTARRHADEFGAVDDYGTQS